MTCKDTSLVGRGEELSRLRELVALPHEESRVLLILGDPGMGKTVLLAEAAREARSAGMRVLTAVGRESEQDLAFAGLHQLLRPVLDRVCLDPMGMVWMKDLMAGKPKPTNTSPGLIYMLNGAIQHSFTDPFDRTSPAIPIGPHWMLIWPFDAKAAGIGTVMRDGGTMVMFAGTPYAHLHICGSPWDGNEYQPGDRGVWTMTYSRP